MKCRSYLSYPEHFRYLVYKLSKTLLIFDSTPLGVFQTGDIFLGADVPHNLTGSILNW